MPTYDSLEFELGVRNMSALVANFHGADAALGQQLRDLARQTGEDIRALTVAYAPKDTEFMADHVRVWYTPSGLGFDVGWRVEDFVEAGFAFYPFFQEFGTVKMAAQPSLGPASAELLPVYRERVSALVRASIDALGQYT